MQGLKCQYQNNPCKVKPCKFIKDEYLEPCGLFSFLNAIKKELSVYPKEKALIRDLRADYVKAWNDNKDSRAKGKATGTAFEKWIKKQIKQKSEKGKVSFSFGEFAIDLAMPSIKNPRVILEVKVYTDTQHTLALGGLLNYSPENRKLCLVTFYEPADVEYKILRDFKEAYKNRFNYFIMERGWSNSIRRLNEFCGARHS